jgi:hypothetical protein
MLALQAAELTMNRKTPVKDGNGCSQPRRAVRYRGRIASQASSVELLVYTHYLLMMLFSPRYW